ncbi:hypothetical protein [Crocosphaera subtropica]|uniref:hypothetical protein n=1 Tax=Crocosphaera subtropica TaxID=2546360 RepID=UPI00030C7994|nr:hypothetical protein [Crocosphaera subtropica]
MIKAFNVLGTDILDNLTETALINAIATTHNYLQAIASNNQFFSIAFFFTTFATLL